jgi:hypothetical protein
MNDNINKNSFLANFSPEIFEKEAALKRKEEIRIILTKLSP